MIVNYLGLFSGCGGFRLGLQQAGVKINKEFHSDIDKYANQTYKRHFPESEALGDIKNIKPVQGKLNGHKINLITFGFPCQDVSIAGDGAGFEGSRSSLFYEATRLIREFEPEIFIFENVKGLFSNQEGRTFTAVLREIADIGLYDCEWQLLNTRWFLPQNRERIYFIGHLRGKSRTQVFPIEENDSPYLRKKGRDGTQTEHVFSTIVTKEGQRKENNFVAGTLRTHNDGKGFRATSNGDCPTIPARAREDGSGQPCVMYSKGRGFNKGGIKKDCGTLTKSSFQNNNFVMGIAEDQYIRRLTPVECCRLHGFPDYWFNHLSDTQAYKQAGNTVSSVIITELFNRLYPENMGAIPCT